VKPILDLGPGLEPVAFSPGRFATVIQRKLKGTHALQLLREDSTASFTLELEADGTAGSCRGWRYQFSNDGPDIHTEERFREQQGYRGHHVTREGFVEVDLQIDDSICPPKHEGQPAPRRSSTLKLRCARVEPRGHAVLTTPALLCQLTPSDASTGEPAAHLVPDIVPDGWMVLGTGNGLRIQVVGRPIGARAGAPTSVVVAPAPEPLGRDAWEHPF
jgi:hypothetical protein